MRKDSIRNPKLRPVSTPSRLVVVGLLLAGAAGVGYCGSGSKGVSVSGSAQGVRASGAADPSAQVVQVTTHPGDVRGCSFLGRVTGPSAEDGSMTTGLLRERVADAGGNVLLLLPAGTGEAWSCGQQARADGKVANPTPVNPITGRFPTPAATPRT